MGDKSVTQGTENYYNKWQLNLLGYIQYFKLHIYTVLFKKKKNHECLVYARLCGMYWRHSDKQEQY